MAASTLLNLQLCTWQRARTWARLIREAENLWHGEIRDLQRLGDHWITGKERDLITVGDGHRCSFGHGIGSGDVCQVSLGKEGLARTGQGDRGQRRRARGVWKREETRARHVTGSS